MNVIKMIKVKNLKKYFPIKGGFLNKKLGDVKAVENINFEIPEGEILGLVGESGSGKTTLGRSIIRLIEPSEGEILYNNKNIMNFNNKEMRALRKEFQIIFQDPFASLDPRKKIFDIIAQGLKIHTSMNREEVNKKVISTIKEVGLQEEHLGRYPHEFSGGQRQRIGIARALVLNPKFIIADEPVSALDVTIQAQILNLILELKEKYSLTILFISHDLSVINQIADKVMVMYLGHIVEMASTKNLFSNPRHPYTKSLIETAPQIFRKNKNKVLLKGDIPSPINPPSGCVFRTRCPNPTHDCKEGNIKMGLIEVSPDHWVDQCCVNCS
jgi:oligopeptide/dipeptide ABC transporter ATP-binding protein